MTSFGLSKTALAQIARTVRPGLKVDADVISTVSAFTSVLGTQVHGGVAVETLFEESFAHEIRAMSAVTQTGLTHEIRAMSAVTQTGLTHEIADTHRTVVAFASAIVARVAASAPVLDMGEWTRIMGTIEHPRSKRMRLSADRKWNEMQQVNRERQQQRTNREMMIRKVNEALSSFKSDMNDAGSRLVDRLDVAITSLAPMT